MVKFYSSETGKYYDTEGEAVQADLKVSNERKAKDLKEKVKNEQRKADAEKVNKALEAARKAKKEANDLLSDFIDKYGSFHTSYTEKDTDLDSELSALADLLSYAFTW